MVPKIWFLFVKNEILTEKMANFGKFWALWLFIFDNLRCLSD